MDQADQERRYAKVIAQAWLDQAFKERLLANPKTVLAEHGIEMAPTTEVRVVEDAENVIHIRLPVADDGDQASA